MRYERFSLDEIPVLFDSEPAGLASLCHDERGLLRIRVLRGELRDALLAAFGNTARPTITSTASAHPSIRAERAILRSTHNALQEFRAYEATVTERVVAPDANVVFRYYVTALEFVGPGFAFEAGGIRWTLERLDFEDGEDHGLKPITATLSTEPVKAHRGNDVDEIVSTVLLLCSFASGTQVVDVRRDQIVAQAIVSRRLRDNHRVVGFGSPLALGIADPGTLKQFIGSCYPHAVSIQRTLPLRQLVHVLLRLRGESVVGTMALLAAHFLEVVRYQYALRVLVPSRRAVRKSRDFFRDAAAKKAGHKLSFEAILTEFCAEHRITHWKPEFKTFRNRIFHGLGVAGVTILDQHERVMEVAHFCEVVILALLNWDIVGGRYLPCTMPETNVTDSKGQHGRVITLGSNLRPFVR